MWTNPPPHTPPEPERTAEQVEAEARVLMAQHSKILARGWQTETQRRMLRDKIDRLLDEHAMRVEVEELTA